MSLSSRSHRRRHSIVLLFDATLLLTSLAFHVWALHYLGHSLANANGIGDRAHAPFATLFTRTSLQTVVGYGATTVRPATLTTASHAGTTYTEVELDGQTTVVIATPPTYTQAPVTIVYAPTATITRTHTTTGMQAIRGYGLGEDYSLLYPLGTLASTTVTPSPSDGAPSPTSSLTLQPGYEWSIDPSNDFASYYTVGRNHGFGKHFVEANVQQDYGSGVQVLGYPTETRRRIEASVALVVVAIVATLVRIAVGPAAAATHHHHAAFFAILDILSTALLAATLVAFWSAYGVWTRRTSITDAAFRWFNAQPLYNDLGIDALYDVHPWPPMAVAYVVLWSAAVVMSIAAVVAGRKTTTTTTTTSNKFG